MGGCLGSGLTVVWGGGGGLFLTLPPPCWANHQGASFGFPTVPTTMASGLSHLSNAAKTPALPGSQRLWEEGQLSVEQAWRVTIGALH